MTIKCSVYILILFLFIFINYDRDTYKLFGIE